MAKRVSKQRRRSAFKEPTAAVLAYQALLREYFRLIEETVLAEFDDWPDAATILDAAAKTPRRLHTPQKRAAYYKRKVRGVSLILAEKITPHKMAKEIGTIAGRVEKKARTEFQKVVGIDVRKSFGAVFDFDGFRKRNVDLIESLQGEAIPKIELLIKEAQEGGWRVETLKDEIKKTFGVSTSKAELLARDQVLKLNGQLVEARQKAAGIDKYIWTTSKDERVREMHEELDGTTQSWDAPPVISEDGRTGHPGEDYQCRCTAYPILDELDELA